MIKNYIFDLGNVVFILDWDKVLNKYDITKEEKELLRNVTFNSKEWVELDGGTILKEEAIKIMLGKLPENLHSYCQDLMSTWKDGLVINNNIINLIKDIKAKGYNTYVLSNAPLEIDEFLDNQNVKNLFDGVLLSAFDKMLKPNKEIYELLLSRFNLNPEESIFIDDKLENVEGAKNLKMDAFQFDFKKFEDLKKYINF